MVEKSVGVQAKKQAHWEVYVYVKAFVSATTDNTPCFITKYFPAQIILAPGKTADLLGHC